MEGGGGIGEDGKIHWVRLGVQIKEKVARDWFIWLFITKWQSVKNTFWLFLIGYFLRSACKIFGESMAFFDPKQKVICAL